MEYDLTYLSLGGGVQSSALLAMGVLGKFNVPKADVAIFADTQGEIGATYAWLQKLKAWAEERGQKVAFTTAGSLEEAVIEGRGASKSHVSIPAFIKTKVMVACACVPVTEVEIEDEPGEMEFSYGPADPSCVACRGTGEVFDGYGKGIQRRQCTYDYKIMAVEKEVRRQLGLPKGGRAKGVHKVRAMLGISYDEIIRMKPSRVEWIDNTYPLIDAKLTREDCKKFLAETFGEVAPRSSCYYCPHHSDSYWRWLRDQHPADFAKAIEMDKKIRKCQPGLIGEAYLHSQLVPLSEVVWKGDDQKKLDGFGAECEGVCGV